MLKLREVRKSRGLSQTALAELVKVNQGYVSDLENGNRVPSFDVLIRLARALKCSLDELVDMESAFKAS